MRRTSSTVVERPAQKAGGLSDREATLRSETTDLVDRTAACHLHIGLDHLA